MRGEQITADNLQRSSVHEASQADETSTKSPSTVPSFALGGMTQLALAERTSPAVLLVADSHGMLKASSMVMLVMLVKRYARTVMVLASTSTCTARAPARCPTRVVTLAPASRECASGTVLRYCRRSNGAQIPAK